MATIVPTITAENPHQYREQIERVQGFARQIHIDIMDGIFTPNNSIELGQVWLPEDIICDIHVMYDKPDVAVEALKSMPIRLLIVQAESSCDFNQLASNLKHENIKFGISLLPDTQVSGCKEAIELADHVLVFSGNLGHQGGSVADLDLLSKIAEIKEVNRDAEIGWDGGVNERNIKAIKNSGVDVINVGGFIHYSPAPEKRFNELLQQIS